MAGLRVRPRVMTPRASWRRGPFGLGTAPLGGLYAPVGEEEAAGALEAAWAGGVRFFDTAPHYGAGHGRAPARRLPARAVRGRRRSCPPRSAGVLVPGAAAPGRRGLLRGHRSGAGARLQPRRRAALARGQPGPHGLDRFDLVLIHDPDDHWEQAVGQAYPALAELRDAGVVGAIGVGMNQSPCWPGSCARPTSTRPGGRPLLAAGPGGGRRPAAAVPTRGVPVDRGRGLQQRRARRPRPTGRTSTTRRRTRRPRPGPARLREICARHGVPLAAAALAFPRRHPAVTRSWSARATPPRWPRTWTCRPGHSRGAVGRAGVGVIDAHHHVWDLAVRDQPWIEPSWPIRRTFTLADLAGAAGAAGVEATVLVQTVADPAETPEFLALAAASAPSAGGRRGRLGRPDRARRGRRAGRPGRGRGRRPARRHPPPGPGRGGPALAVPAGRAARACARSARPASPTTC